MKRLNASVNPYPYDETTLPPIPEPMKEEVILQRDPTLSKCIAKVRPTVERLQTFLRADRPARKAVGLPPAADLSGLLGTYQDGQALFLIYQRYNIGQAPLGQSFDSLIAQTWVASIKRKFAHQLYEHTKGIVGGVRMTLESFLKNADMSPFEQPCEAILNLGTYLHKTLYHERVNPEFLRVIEITGRTPEPLKDYETILTERLTKYATPKQAEYLQKVEGVLEQMNAIEKEYKAPGLTLQAVHLNGSGYEFDRTALERISG